MEVDDPYEPDAKLSVGINVKHDLVLWMYNGKRIDHAQYKAGNRFLGLLEHAEEARGLAVDPSRDVVDGSSGRFISPEITEARERAISELRRITRYLGNRDYQLACRVIRDNTTIKAIAEGNKLKAEYLNRRFKDLL